MLARETGQKRHMLSTGDSQLGTVVNLQEGQKQRGLLHGELWDGDVRQIDLVTR